jgi:hypothetical protein
VTTAITVNSIELETRRPFTNYKPEFLTQVWTLAGADATSVSYIDCDVVVACEWAFLRAWVANGLALVEDNPARTVGINHPLRQAWSSFMSTAGVHPQRVLGQYFNAGFVGMPASCRSILPMWATLTQALERTPALTNGSRGRHIRGERLTGDAIEVPEDVLAVMRPHLIEDQDALNMAVAATTVPVSAMGPDAMGLTTLRTPILAHAIGSDKPWSVDYLRRMIRHGHGPSFADDMWWLYSDGPIVVDAARDVRRRWSYAVAKVLRRYL